MLMDFHNLAAIRNEEITFVIGAFDILHVGHVHFLNEAKKAGNNHKLLVGIIPDEIVRDRKGADRPVNSEQERAEIVNSLKMVDYVFIAPELPVGEVAKSVIEMVKPEYAVASKNDWEKRTEDWQTGGTELILIDKIPERSTTKIVQKIRE